jgi:hypothetical protein
MLFRHIRPRQHDRRFLCGGQKTCPVAVVLSEYGNIFLPAQRADARAELEPTRERLVVHVNTFSPHSGMRTHGRLDDLLAHIVERALDPELHNTPGQTSPTRRHVRAVGGAGHSYTRCPGGGCAPPTPTSCDHDRLVPQDGSEDGVSETGFVACSCISSRCARCG